ncbi:MAG: chemotaxis response regulator protein-glutamate methylesterase [Neomegalonema sp.]|nr:chemotaxis response regulator protein-glutamate methylesterase [Neomegalonema sp.]
MTAMGPNRPVRVVVVDDSVLMRTMLRSALEVDGDIDVAGSAAEPYAARDMIKRVNPDVVTLDVEMPGMNGLEFLDKIMRLRPMPVVMVSSLTSAGADATLTALEFGAVDFVAKPAGNAGMREFGEIVRRKVRAASKARIRQGASAARPRPQPQAFKRSGGVGLIAIGASTGGVSAIGSIVQRLPRGLPPVVAVVHMPENYTGRFAARLASQTGHDVAEAREGEKLRPGAIRIAPGSHHLEVAKAGTEYVTKLSMSDPVSGHRPSVDVCFRSVAAAAGGQGLGVILTGMGRDGASGLLQMRQAGALCLGESEKSCVVYGMPKAARDAGAVNEEHHLEKLPDRICELVSGKSYRA